MSKQARTVRMPGGRGLENAAKCSPMFPLVLVGVLPQPRQQLEELRRLNQLPVHRDVGLPVRSKGLVEA